VPIDAFIKFLPEVLAHNPDEFHAHLKNTILEYYCILD